MLCTDLLAAGVVAERGRGERESSVGRVGLGTSGHLPGLLADTHTRPLDCGLTRVRLTHCYEGAPVRLTTLELVLATGSLTPRRHWTPCILILFLELVPVAISRDYRDFHIGNLSLREEITTNSIDKQHL